MSPWKKPGGYSFIHDGICCKSLARRAFLKGSTELEVTGPRTANRSCDWLRHYGGEVMDHPSHSHDIAPSCFCFFGHVKKQLADQ